jgi:hypothetical protein
VPLVLAQLSLSRTSRLPYQFEQNAGTFFAPALVKTLFAPLTIRLCSVAFIWPVDDFNYLTRQSVVGHTLNQLFASILTGVGPDKHRLLFIFFSHLGPYVAHDSAIPLKSNPIRRF